MLDCLQPRHRRGAETAIPVGEPIYPNYRDFSSVPPEHMKWHDVVGSKWRRWGHRHPYLQGGMGLAGTSAMSGGVFLAMQALSNKLLNPGPDAELIKANQKLSTNLGEVTNRLHQEVGKSALATDVLVNAVHTGDVPAAIVEEAKAMKESRAVEEKKTKLTTSSTKTLQVTTTPGDEEKPQQPRLLRRRTLQIQEQLDLIFRIRFGTFGDLMRIRKPKLQTNEH